MRIEPVLSTSIVVLTVLLGADTAAAGEKMGKAEEALRSTEGTVTVVSVGAAWCPPCMNAWAGMQTWAAQHPGSGVRLLGVSVDEDPERARKQFSKRGLEIPFAWGAYEGGAAEAMTEAFGASGVPMTFVVGPDGRIYRYVYGYTKPRSGLKGRQAAQVADWNDLLAAAASLAKDPKSIEPNLKTPVTLADLLGDVKPSKTVPDKRGSGAQHPLVGQAPPTLAAEMWLNADRAPDLSKLKGQVVHIQICAWWARPCVERFIHYQAKLKKGRPHRAVLMVPVPDKKKAQKFLKEHNADHKTQTVYYPVGIGEKDTIYGGWTIRLVPFNAIIGRDGKVAWSFAGFRVTEDEIARELDKALAAPEPKPGNGGLDDKARLRCSENILSNLFKPGRLTASDLRNVWSLGRLTHLSDPEGLKFDAGRVPLQESVHDKFFALQLYSMGNPKSAPPELKPGDLLVYRLPWHPDGALIVIKEYDPKTLKMKVSLLEEKNRKDQSFDTWPLTLSKPDAATWYIRPGLMWLRPKKSDLCNAKAL